MKEPFASEARFKALVAATSDVVFILSADWEVMYKLDDHGLSSDSSPITGWRETYVHPEDLAMFDLKVAEAMVSKCIFELEHRVLNADGTTGWVSCKTVPILNAEGEILEWFGAVSNITTRKQVEADLQFAKEEAEHHQSIYESINSTTPDLIYVLSLDYRFRYANRALTEMLGKPKEEVIGRNLLENGYEPWHAEKHEREIDQIAATGVAIRGEIAFLHAIFGWRTYDYIFNPIIDASGKVVAVSGTTRDVTNRKAIELEKVKLSDDLAMLNEEAAAANEELNATNEELIASQNLLDEANRNLAQILNMLPASVVVIRGHELVVEMINDSNLKYWNKTREEVLGRPFLEILPDLANQPFAGQLRKVIETGEIIDVKESPVLFENPDGSLRETYVDYTYQPLLDATSNRTGVLVMSFEITEKVFARKLLEQYTEELAQINELLSVANNELARSEGRFKFLIQEAPIAIGVLQSRDLLVETANQKILEVWGKTAAILGKPIAQALPELQGQPFLEILDKIFLTGEAFSANEIKAVLEHDGELRDMYFNVVYQPITDLEGRVKDILVVAVDVTEQVLSRKRLELSEQHFRSLADLVPAKISNANPNGDVIFLNQKWLEFAGLGFEDMRDYGYHQMMHPEEIETFQQGLATAANKRDAYASEMRFKNVEGKYIWHLNVTSPILDEKGDITMWVGSTTDIQSLKEEEQRKSEFVSMLSHELKTPVTSIKGHVQLLLRLISKEEPTEFLYKMNSSLSRIDVLLIHLTGLISEMLDLSRIDAGRMDLNLEVFPIDRLVKEVVQDFKLSHQHHFFHVETPVAVRVTADRDRISQVLINLIANAIKYSPNSKVVDVSLEVVDKEVLIAVKDYGIGIEEKDQQRIFERFVRVEGQNEKQYSGFGIGLFLAHNIVTRHGGKITVVSERGKGSVFTVHLPIV